MYFCAICNKSFAGASGLWYHNKHVHNAITQSRPRGKSKKLKTTIILSKIIIIIIQTYV